MQQFHSLPPSQSNDADTAGEHHRYYPHMIPPTVLPDTFDISSYTDPIPAVSLTDTDPLTPAKTIDYPVSGPLHDVPTTQSLISALQSTMQGGVRPPVVIPGSEKSTRRLKETGALPAKTRRIHPRLRIALVWTSTAFVLFFTLFSFTSLGSGQSGIPLFDNVIRWAQAQQQGGATVASINMVTPTTAPAAAAAPVPMTLPKSQYIAIAQQAAAAAGIPVDAFVRQINQESGFNPYAVSPAGAVGIAQFEPATAAGLGINPYDPVQALYGAANYMARLAAQFGGDYAKGLAAYNAGSGAVQTAVNEGGANWLSFLPAETQNYVNIIMG